MTKKHTGKYAFTEEKSDTCSIPQGKFNYNVPKFNRKAEATKSKTVKLDMFTKNKVNEAFIYPDVIKETFEFFDVIVSNNLDEKKAMNLLVAVGDAFSQIADFFKVVRPRIGLKRITLLIGKKSSNATSIGITENTTNLIQKFVYAIDSIMGQEEGCKTLFISGGSSRSNKISMDKLEKNGFSGVAEYIFYKFLWDSPTKESSLGRRLKNSVSRSELFAEIFANLVSPHVKNNRLCGKPKMKITVKLHQLLKEYMRNALLHFNPEEIFNESFPEQSETIPDRSEFIPENELFNNPPEMSEADYDEEMRKLNELL